MLPTDGHVHTEWSWDSPRGSMEGACAQAVEAGVPAIVFSDHLDFTAWKLAAEEVPEGFEWLEQYVDADRNLRPPTFEVDGYLDCVERCRARFPELRIITGAEYGEPHRNSAASSHAERVNGSLHSLQVGESYYEPPGLYRQWSPDRVIREYLAELLRMINSAAAFDVLSHIDYAVRYWPSDAEPFDPGEFEDEFRQALRALAGTGRALEFNTSHPSVWILPWWRAEGGRTLSFGSDAHEPSRVAQRFTDAVAAAESHGFRPGRHPADLWVRD